MEIERKFLIYKEICLQILILIHITDWNRVTYPPHR